MAKLFHRKLFHRKLFSNLNSTSSTNESTYRCTDFCDPACGNLEDCYSFPEPEELLPPLPPPLPPISIVVSPSTPNLGIQISPAVIIIVVVLASMFLLISCYTIIFKYRKLYNHFIISREHDEPPQVDNTTQGDSHLTEAFMHDDENGHSPVVDHPVWLISTIGLQQSVINSITMVRYKRDDGLIDGTDCPVCLSEFQEGETLRLLPKCKHAFHIDCIDTWLRSHTNCPLCRAAIMANSGRQSLASNNPSLGPSRRIELAQMIDSGSREDVEPGNSQTGDNNRVVEMREENNNVDRNIEQNKAAQNGFNIVIRRSLSMEFFRGSSTETVGTSNSQAISFNSSSIRLMSSSCSSSRPQPPPTASLIKRSYSCSDRVFCSTSSSQNNSSQDMSP